MNPHSCPIFAKLAFRADTPICVANLIYFAFYQPQAIFFVPPFFTAHVKRYILQAAIV